MRKLEKGRDQFFPSELGQEIMNGAQKLQYDNAQILYILDLGLKKFFMKTLLILPRFHEKTLSRSGDIKTLFPRRMYM